MPSTTNFGWTTPADTDLVKDGASAIRTLGNGIDTSFVDLKGGTTGQVLSKNSNTDLDFTWVAQDDSNAIQNAIVDAKGDLITATAADTPARLAVGTNGQYLIADSTTATGLKWGDVSAGAYTSLATGSLSTNSVTISSINGSYRDLMLVVLAPVSSLSDRINFRVNNITSSDYSNITMRSNGTTLGSSINYSFFDPSASNISVQTTNNNQIYTLEIKNYASTGYKSYEMLSSSSDNSVISIGHQLSTTAAITSITIKLNDPGRTFTGGTYTLYGVK